MALFKEGSVDEVNNYGLIFLTTLPFSKVFGRLIYNRLVDVFGKYEHLSSAHFGFRRISGTNDAKSVYVDNFQTSFLVKN